MISSYNLSRWQLRQILRRVLEELGVAGIAAELHLLAIVIVNLLVAHGVKVIVGDEADLFSIYHKIIGCIQV